MSKLRWHAIRLVAYQHGDPVEIRLAGNMRWDWIVRRDDRQIAYGQERTRTLAREAAQRWFNEHPLKMEG